MALVPIDFSKGVLDSTKNPYDIPPGFSRYMYNWVPDEYGNLITRYSMRDSAYQVSGVSVTPATYALGMDDLNMVTLGTGSGALAAAIWWNPQRTTAPGIAALNKAGGTGNDVGSFAFAYSKPSFAEYNSVIYASTLASGVRKITALNFSTNAITEAAVASSPNLAGILSFKNRMFGWINNRVYFTDVPSAGLYPDTWNTAANFFDVGSSKGTPVIKSILPVENRLYVFTDSGLFSVLISGPASTWVQRSVDETVKVFDRAACFVYKNLMYYVDEESIWVTDGSEFKEIGSAMSDRLTKPSGSNVLIRNRIFRSDNTIIFSRRELIGSVATSYIKMADLDAFKWSDLWVWKDSNLSEISGTLNNLSTKQWTGKSSYIMGSIVEATFEQIYLFRKEEPSIDAQDDKISSTNYIIKCSTSTGFLDFGEPLKYKVLNYALIELSSPLVLTTNLIVTFYTDQISDGGATIVVTVPGAGPFYNQILVKVEGPERPFKWLEMSIQSSNQVYIKKVWVDIDMSADVEPQVYSSKQP